MNAPIQTAHPVSDDLDRLFARQRAAFAAERNPAFAARRDRLARLLHIVTAHEQKFVAAIDRDFGHRSAHETRLAELYIVAAEARHAQKHLNRWMRSERVSTPLHLLPATAWIERQPLGVVGVISPWNYPVQLALAPVVGALAAGNRVLLKPSEVTPATSALLRDLIAADFATEELAVVIGDADTGRAFTRLPFDHLFFTGSTAVGCEVARAAAENLTPVTLELGGKSPAIFDPEVDLAWAVPRLMVGKLLNAGQTCIAPDYALVPQSRVDEFEKVAMASVARLYPSLAANPDYTTIVNERHFTRLKALLDDARAAGARIVPMGDSDQSRRRLAPTLVVGVDDRMAIMREEIFGPLLPVETYGALDDAIARVNARPRPLAFYWFGTDAARRERALADTAAGGVTINDTLWHFAHENLPFGGIGPSGMGAYHGERGFLTFSHQKPVFEQRRLAASGLLRPPYGAMFERVLALLRGLNT